MTEMWFEILVGFAVLGGFMFAVASLTFTVTRALSAVSKEDITKLEANRREDTARLEANRREDTARLEASISALTAKFDKYLFGELAKKKKSPK